MSSQLSNEQSPTGASVYRVGGSLPVDAPTYVERQADRQLYDRLKAGECCYVFNSRQMGKSSLRVRTIQKLERDGIRCATLDPQTIGTQLDQSQWYASVISSLVESFGLEERFDLETWWESKHLLTSVKRLNDFISNVLLTEISQPIVIFVEEIDSLLNLDFKADDFFMMIRSFYENRAQELRFQRLSFAFVGVTTPRDLIQGHNHSAFNIGVAIALDGFQLEEVQPLSIGLEGKAINPTAVMVEVLRWTGGQPFLTQKLLSMVIGELEHGNDLSGNDIAGWIAEVVRVRIIDNWEAQDVPQHLKTLQDRMLRIDERGRGRLLGLYQQVLGDAPLAPQYWGGQDVKSPSIGGFRGLDVENVSYGIAADDSDEQIQLRLTGLVVKWGNRLTVYNPIYAAVFNQAWVERTLADLRPALYAEALSQWKESAEQKESFLLRGQALEDAENWAKGKQLSKEDDRFLSDSRALERRETDRELEAERQIRAKLEQANLTASRRIRIGSIVLIGTLLVAGVVAGGSIGDAKRRVAETEKAAKEVTDKANRDKDEAERKALDADRRKQQADEKTKKAAVDLIKAQGEKAKAKAEKEKADVEVAKAEMQLASAKEELRRAEEGTERSEAATLVALNKIALADVKLKTVNAKVALLDNKGIEFILLAVDAGNKLKQIAARSQEWQELKQDILTVLQQATYRVPEQNRLQGHTDVVWSANFSADGSKIVTASSDKTARVWDVKGNLIAELKGHTSSVISANFSADGSKIVTTASRGKTARVWDVKGNLIAELKGVDTDWVRSANFSADGSKIVTASSDGTARVWDVKGNLIAKLKWHTGSVSSANFSADGSKIVTASADKTARVWDVKGNLIAELKGHTSSVISANFSADGSKIVTASADKTARVWDVKGNQLAELKGHTDWVGSADFTADGNKIVTASRGNTAWVLDVKGNQLAELKGHTGVVISANFSADGSKIVTASWDGTARVWDVKGNQLAELKGHTGVVDSANFSADGSKIVTASWDKTARVWDVKGNLITELKGHTDWVISANFSADGSKIVTASNDKMARVWEIENDFDRLLIGLCNNLHDYLSTNPNATDSDRQMCGISPRQK